LLPVGQRVEHVKKAPYKQDQGSDGYASSVDFSSPRGHGIVLLATLVMSVLVALVGVERALSRRMTRLRAWLTALVVALLVAGLEFATLIVLALHELSRLDGS
jgi:hypothetical protein